MLGKLDSCISPITDILEDARCGRMFILVDGENRENEGDLMIPAQMVTPQAINFMARRGCGLICLSLSVERAEQLALELMPNRHRKGCQGTAFTVSIEARDGISTGISAEDRAKTVAVAIDSTKGLQDIVTPGHIFPLIARNGGVLVRPGHTEAAVDIARLAGLKPAGVICEVMNEDGSMARLPDLVLFGQRYGLKIGTVTDLISYRLSRGTCIQCIRRSTLNHDKYGSFQILNYVDEFGHDEHVVIVKGTILLDKPVRVYFQTVRRQEDLEAISSGKHSLIDEAMMIIGDENCAVAIFSAGLSLCLGMTNLNYFDCDQDDRSIEQGIAPKILSTLGVRYVNLTSSLSVHDEVGLGEHGLEVLSWQKIKGV